MINSKQIRYRPKILLVDDQEINRDILGVILEDDYDLIYAENGEEALKLMNSSYESLSLVMLDLMMPVMDGFKVLEIVEQDERLKKIPIIVLTAEKSAELKALQMGAADFITKPFNVHEIILARVSRIIELSEGRKLITAAERDHLSGLYTRSFFYEYAERIYDHHPERKMDAVMIDVEQFHSVNAMHGRKFADLVLQTIGNEIRSFLQENSGIASRHEADRFYIYCLPLKDYRVLLERLQKKVDGLSPGVSIHLRMGVAPYSAGIEPVALSDRARTACNMVRGNYQNPLMVYNEDMRLKELLNQRLLNDLNKAIEEKQFTVYYQAKYDIQSDPPRLSSAEALIRWQHPQLGMISPADFIPLFEGNGLISIIDHYVWKQAASQVARWRDELGFNLPVSVNLSRADFLDPLLVEKMEDLVRENSLEHADMKLEVTESAYTDDGKQLLEIVRKLRDIGFEIEMDDFGSGYSSLNMLSDMPVDILKMDMKFVRNIENSETDLKLVKLILDLARYLQVHVVAEGVETKGQLSLLKNAGCDLVQGFYFAKPLPPEEFEKLIKEEIEKRRSIS